MNTSAIVMLVLILVVFIGGIGICIGRVGRGGDSSTADD